MSLDDYPHPVFDPKAVGGYRHSDACDPEWGCCCNLDEALLDTERLAMETEQ